MGVLHTARIGDSFASIARAFGISASALADQNPYVDPSALKAGQTLCVPAASAKGTPMRMGFGQTLEDIITRHGLSLAQFQEMNPGVDVDRLAPGQQYFI